MIFRPKPKFWAALMFWLGLAPLGMRPVLTMPLMTLTPSSLRKMKGGSNLMSLDS